MIRGETRSASGRKEFRQRAEIQRERNCVGNFGTTVFRARRYGGRSGDLEAVEANLNGTE